MQPLRHFAQGGRVMLRDEVAGFFVFQKGLMHQIKMVAAHRLPACE